MNTIYMLILLIIPGDGQLRVAYDKEQFATVEECRARAEQRMEQLEKKVLWVSTSCASVPANPGGKEI
jgi:hypothetical protein